METTNIEACRLWQIARARLEGAQDLLNKLIAAGQLSPVAIEACKPGTAHLKKQEEQAWDAYMASFNNHEVAAEVLLVRPALRRGARHRRFRHRKPRATR